MSEEKMPEWLEDLANLDVGGGNYVPSADGLIIVFSLVDHTEEPAEVKKTYEGKDVGVKKQWKIFVHKLEFHKDAYREILSDKKPKKLETIEKFPNDTEAILELSKTASKELAKFMIAEKITSKDVIRYLRLGDSFDTEYKFRKANK